MVNIQLNHIIKIYTEILDYCTYLSIREANGCTLSEDPIMISRSHSGKSVVEFVKKLEGKLSPKKTISGLTIPLQSAQVGTMSENI